MPFTEAGRWLHKALADLNTQEEHAITTLSDDLPGSY